MKVKVNTPTPNCRWLGFVLSRDTSDGKVQFVAGLWWKVVMFYYPHEEA